MARKILILGAAGRDFHNFNVFYRNDPDVEVVAFTATQIPGIDGRRYPTELAGPRYPHGIPIEAEDDLEKLIAELSVDEVVFAYSDVPYEHVMHLGARVQTAGANYTMLGARPTQVASTKPVVAVCAARTGAGKSQTSRRVAEVLTSMGKKVAVIRHPMPYGDLAKQAVQRFATYDDLAKHDVTIEEREEYEPHIEAGRVLFAGVDYEAILREAEKEADVIIWDGGNNDMSFYTADLTITVVDPHRPDHAARYFPGEVNVRMADVVVVNKVDTADYANVQLAREITEQLNPNAVIIEAASPISVEKPELIRGKRVVVVEDGPTLTHGGMAYGAGRVAAKRYGAAEIIDPHEYAVGSIKDTYDKYPTTGDILPAMGYGDAQIADLTETLKRVPADTIVIGTPIDLSRLIQLDKPSVRVRYELQEIGRPSLRDMLDAFVTKMDAAPKKAKSAV
ncbi:cyclic 2,3-diphosphoglycerate synthase [bacterium]|nr:cyclic 2,3-diphosphoglycerate synthase [bacterium]